MDVKLLLGRPTLNLRIWWLRVRPAPGAPFVFNMDENPLPLVRLLLARLERISADSVWAHRASGVRGALFKALETIENGEHVSSQTLMSLCQLGFNILEQAAKLKQ